MESERPDISEFRDADLYQGKVPSEMDRVINSEFGECSPVSIFIRESEVPVSFHKWQGQVAAAAWINSPRFRDRFQGVDWVDYLFPVFPSAISKVKELEEYKHSALNPPMWHVSDTSGRHYATRDSVIELIQASDIQVTALVYVSDSFDLSEFEEQFPEVEVDTSPEDYKAID